LHKDEFDQKKKNAHSSGVPTLHGDLVGELSSRGNESYWKSNAFLKELADRELMNREGKLTTIIFIRCLNSKGHEVSGYIDYAQRLKTDDFKGFVLS